MQLLLDRQYLTDKTIIDDNVDFSKLTQLIEDVQFLKIEPLLGSNLYNLILTQSTPTTTLTADNLNLLNNYILPCMCRYLLSECVIPFKYRFMNVGVIVKIGTEQSNPIEAASELVVIDYWKNKGEEYGQRMQNFIRANPSKYPAYFTNTGYDQRKPESTAFEVDIFLDDCPGRADYDRSTGDFRYRNNGYNG
jgi:hypothetical protein